MAIDSKHPLYVENVEDWVLMRDTYEGEKVIKDKTTVYLPPTAGHVVDGLGANQPGSAAYAAYLQRAVFPDYVADGVNTLVGLLHQKEATIDLPAAMEPLREDATVGNESLLTLLRNINEQQLIPGRCGLLLDLPENPDPTNPLPYISMYLAEAIINWDESSDKEDKDKLNMVVLDETGPARTDNFNWETKEKFRVLLFGDAADQDEVVSTVYRMGVFDKGTSFSEGNLIEPVYRGNKLDVLPFVFVNGQDIIAQPDRPPLIGLGRLSLTIYRGEADYRQSLYLQGQDTLVVIGDVITSDPDGAEKGPIRVGAGSHINVGIGGDAKFAGVSSEGLAEQRMSLENDRKIAGTKSAQLIQPGAIGVESGEALKIRVGAQTATLNQVALSGAAALENILKTCARWMGANEDEVVVTPNLDFGTGDMTGKELSELMTGKTLGAPISMETVHENMQKKGMTTKTFEEEMDLLDNEVVEPPPAGTGVEEEDEGTVVEEEGSNLDG